jgi:hypothetical protein
MLISDNWAAIAREGYDFLDKRRRLNFYEKNDENEKKQNGPIGGRA